ncbi:MAG: tetratricopeptide repeat protein [Candidatus Polarisedimenticolia bacterium]
MIRDSLRPLWAGGYFVLRICHLCSRRGTLFATCTPFLVPCQSISPVPHSTVHLNADAQAHNNRGVVKLELGDFAGAAEDFRLALKLDPSLAEAERNLRRLTTDRR